MESGMAMEGRERAGMLPAKMPNAAALRRAAAGFPDFQHHGAGRDVCVTRGDAGHAEFMGKATNCEARTVRG
jgi:hypothetical protein